MGIPRFFFGEFLVALVFIAGSGAVVIDWSLFHGVAVCGGIVSIADSAAAVVRVCLLGFGSKCMCVCSYGTPATVVLYVYYLHHMHCGDGASVAIGGVLCVLYVSWLSLLVVGLQTLSGVFMYGLFALPVFCITSVCVASVGILCSLCMVWR